MGKATPDAVLDAMFDNKINISDKMMACSAEPTTYYEAVDPAAWQASTAYSLGDAIRPTTRDGRTYECTTAGTSGASEPTWDTTLGNTTNDNTAVWTTRNDVSLSEGATMSGGDFTKANGDTSGRKVTVGQKAGVNVHTTGTANHIALVDDGNKELIYVTTCTSQALTSGNTITFNAWDIEVADPT